MMSKAKGKEENHLWDTQLQQKHLKQTYLLGIDLDNQSYSQREMPKLDLYLTHGVNMKTAKSPQQSHVFTFSVRDNIKGGNRMFQLSRGNTDHAERKREKELF